MKGIAYSYLRFSTPEQAMGDSRRRQLALAEDYARKHGLLVDKSLNFRDLGISAFRGKSAKEGGLRSFLDAVEYGLVPANSFLLVGRADIDDVPIVATPGRELARIRTGEDEPSPERTREAASGNHSDSGRSERALRRPGAD